MASSSVNFCRKRAPYTIGQHVVSNCQQLVRISGLRVSVDKSYGLDGSHKSLQWRVTSSVVCDAISVVWRHQRCVTSSVLTKAMALMVATKACSVATEFAVSTSKGVNTRASCHLLARMQELRASRRGNQWHPRVQIT
jgi:hypothetical protein